jgi:hypothetical protein
MEGRQEPPESDVISIILHMKSIIKSVGSWSRQYVLVLYWLHNLIDIDAPLQHRLRCMSHMYMMVPD